MTASEYFSQFKTQLEKLKKEIEKKIKSLESTPEMGNEVDPDLETQETQEIDNRLSIAQELKNQLIAINSALQKFAKNKYGICENCGKEISTNLLKVVPESRYCKDCKRSTH